MAENKKSFIVYTDWYGTFKSLPDDVAGKLIKHVFSYVNDEDPTTEDFVINALFEQIKSTLKRDLQKYESIKGKQSESGAIGNLKRWNKDLYDKVISKKLSLEDAIIIAKSRKESVPDKKESGVIAEIADSVNGNVSDNATDNEIKETIELGDKSPPPPKLSSKDEKIKKRLERELDFGKSLIPYTEEYGAEMIRKFYDYWREPTPSGSKMKWEIEKTWELKLRINKWQQNQDKWDKSKIKKNGDELKTGISEAEESRKRLEKFIK